MSAIEFVARMAGVPQELIDEVEKAAPQTAALLKLVKDNQDLLLKLEALVTAATPEIMALIPTAQDVLKFIQAQQATPQQAPKPVAHETH